jgi:hypothetical protein
MQYIEAIQEVGTILDGFNKDSNNKWSFRCPYCGDSKKKKNKRRGNIFEINGKYMYHCYNCNTSISFINFIKDISPETYHKVSFNKFKQSNQSLKIPVLSKPKITSNEFQKVCVKLSDLDDNHSAVQYCKNRMLPKCRYDDLYYINDFSKLSYYFPQYKELPEDERIIIPYNSRNGDFFALQGRSMNKSALRYITLRHNEHPLIQGLNKIDLSKTVFCTEGAFDSFFLPNCISVGGADLGRIEEYVLKSKVILILDNEPRNKQIVRYSLYYLMFELALY